MKLLISIILILFSTITFISCPSMYDQSKNGSDGLILTANLGGVNYMETNKVVHILTTIK